MVRTTEEKLFGTVDLYRIIVDAAEEGIWVADKADKITYVNKKLTDLLGYSREEIIGKNIFDFTDEKNRAIIKESIERNRRGERDNYPCSLRNKRGDYVLLLMASTPMHDHTGHYIGTVQLGSAMSSQKMVEDELREARGRSDMYLDLLSHDIRNMDQVAMGYLELVINKLDAGESLTNADRDFIEKPLNAIKSSAGLIETVKNLQKVKSAWMPLEEIDLGEIVSGVVSGLAGGSGRLINIRYRPVTGCWIKANYLLKEVFINLMGNAAQHSNGPLDITISLNEVRREGARYYAVTVEDNGPGIPDEQKATLFSDAHCEGTMTRGKGLGLCLVKWIVDRFNGNVRVEDRVPGDHTQGARFVVILPAIEAGKHKAQVYQDARH